MDRLRVALVFVALTCLVPWCAAAPSTTLDAAFSRATLEHRVEVLEDPTGALDFDAVRVSSAFKPAPALGTNFGFTHSTWWVRFTLVNPDAADRHVTLREDYPLIDYLALWSIDRAGAWHSTETGDRTIFSTREYTHRDFLFDLEVPARSERTYYLRAASSGPVDLSLSLYESHALIGTVSNEQLAYGGYYGGFLVLVLYNFFLFIIVRDRAIFYYLLYASSYGLYFAVHNGLAFQFLWPDSPAWGNQALLVLLASTLVFGLQFTRAFLSTSSVLPRLDKVAIALQILAGISLVASFFTPYSVLILPLALLTIVVTCQIITMGTMGLIKGYRPARYFMVAWGMLLVGVMAYMFKVFGLLPHNMLTQNGFQVGSLMEMVLLSLALASRLSDLRRQSRTDTLTGIPNRRYFDEVAANEFERARRNQSPLALLVVDIDHFKQFNDRHGHARGDEVLQVVADKLSRGVRRGDSVCRYGGEEFAVILPGADGTTAMKVAESLRSAVEGNASADAQITISIGAASTRDGEFADVDEMFRAADSALYRAKDLGRNRAIRFANSAANGREQPRNDASKPVDRPG
ncbi:MAG: diguanylate cyclase [Dokdonella sp.]|uniref:diguanylate cyclase n=1 Tax=Dokdonella sp. TaxID=2291710 RepID=UPI0032670EE6